MLQYIYNMKFVPTKNDFWFKLKPLSNPDREEKLFLYNLGEWSISSEDNFKKHLNRYDYLNKYYAHLNGTRIKKVVQSEPLWYSRFGLEKLLYPKKSLFMRKKNLLTKQEKYNFIIL